ncbi:MAG: hypothetical protein FWC71_05515 [Defluviitaleaceae bacterium]|nr:hypothetical protein [Defluviitaleaceae bacterium]
MLIKQNIIKLLNEIRYPRSEYWITAGAALVMHGVKVQTNDIDLGCSTALADCLIKEGFEWRVADDGIRIITADDIEFLENWCGDGTVELDGFYVASLDCIRREKVKLNRPKDWVDIKLIDGEAVS